MPGEDPKQTEINDLLMRKYTLLKQEALIVMGFYKHHKTSFQLLVTGVLGVLGLVATQKIPEPSAGNWFLWWAFATLLWVVVLYLAFDVWETQYHMALLGERLATIEQRLNRNLSERVFIWETGVPPKYWTRFKPLPSLVNPDWFLSAWGAALFLLTAVIAPGYIYFRLWNLLDAPGERLARAIILAGFISSVACSLVSILIGIQVLLRMRGQIRNDFNKMLSTPLDRSIIQSETTNQRKFSPIASLVIVLGVLLSAAASYVEGTFTDKSVTIGFVEHGGMWGDLIIMAAVGGIVFPHLVKKWSFTLFSIAIALIITVVAHSEWAQMSQREGITGHIFPTHATGLWYHDISIAGWLHVAVMGGLSALIIMYVVSPVPRKIVLIVSILLTAQVFVGTVEPGWFCTGRLWTLKNFMVPMISTVLIWTVALIKRRSTAKEG